MRLAGRYRSLVFKPENVRQRAEFIVLMTIFCDRKRSSVELHQPSAHFFGKSKAECKSIAVNEGWLFRDVDHTATCPACCKQRHYKIDAVANTLRK
jgi:hypothetical protein